MDTSGGSEQDGEYNLRSGLWSVTTANRNPCSQFLNRSYENTTANTSLLVWECLVSASKNGRLVKATG